MDSRSRSLDVLVFTVGAGALGAEITAARLKEIGAEGFAAPMKVTCENHNGHNAAFVSEWDGTKWTKVSDWISPIKEKVVPLIEQASKDYVGANAGWPKRSEPCDKSS